MKMITTLTLSSLIGLSSLFGSNFNVDTTHSSLDFKVKHMMISNTKGSFSDYSGTFSYDAKTKQLSALNGSVNVASISTQDAKRDGHLKSPEFFDVGTYPQMQMKFVSQKNEKVIVALTIKDVTKNIEFEMDDASGLVKDGWGGTRAAFSLSGKINRKDFHIQFSQLLETGELVVGNQVKLNLEIEGTQEK